MKFTIDRTQPQPKRRRLQHDTYPIFELNHGWVKLFDLPRHGYIHRIVFEPMAPHILCTIQVDQSLIVNRVPLSKRLHAIYVKTDMRFHAYAQLKLENVSPNLDYTGCYIIRMSTWY